MSAVSLRSVPSESLVELRCGGERFHVRAGELKAQGFSWLEVLADGHYTKNGMRFYRDLPRTFFTRFASLSERLDGAA